MLPEIDSPIAMSTEDGRKAELAAQAGQARTHSDEDLAIIADLVVFRQMPYLSARMLIQLNCESWPVWKAFNLDRIAEARRLDDTRDWYFPLTVPRKPMLESSFRQRSKKRKTSRLHQEENSDAEEQVQHPPEHWWSLKGIWHSSASHAESEIARSIPSMKFLPYDFLHHSLPHGDILACQGGLFLIKGTVRVRRSPRLNPELAACSDAKEASAGLTTANHVESPNWQLCWTRLLVCNPLTKSHRELPAANSDLVGLPSWALTCDAGVQATLLVNERDNSYQVILTLSRYILVYKSSTNSWNSSGPIRERRPWYVHIPISPAYNRTGALRSLRQWGIQCANAHVQGRLFFADICSTADLQAGMQPTPNPTDVGKIRVFEVNVEAGQWHALQEYTIRKFHMPLLNRVVGAGFPFDLSIFQSMEMVECGGQLFVVVCAMAHDALIIGEHQSNEWRTQVVLSEGNTGGASVCMPLCFYVMELQEQGAGAGVDHGVLRIQVPRTRSDFNSRVQRMRAAVRWSRTLGNNIFSCHARGNVIWVAYEDYLLSYDVVSRNAKTEIIPPNPISAAHVGDELLRFAYTPSLHMKP